MIHKLFLLFITCGLLNHASGQGYRSINGFVTDSITKEVLIGATVYDIKSGKGVISNEFGYYNILVDKDSTVALEVSFIGYQSRLVKVSLNKQRVDFFLHPGIDLGVVEISASKPADIIHSTETSVTRLPMREIKMLPNLFGEVDIIKAFQLTPGVQSGGEAKSDMYIRGGSPDQNLIILDDMPLYYVAHFGGFFSIFNSDAINDVKLIKGGFPARYGGKLSSVLDVRMKDGNINSFKGQGSVGLLSSKIMLEGPLGNQKSSYMVSARVNTLPFFRLWGVDLSYNFYDLNAKINYHLSGKDRLFLSFYSGDDMITIKRKASNSFLKSQAKWGNIAGSLRYNRIINSKLFGNFIIALTKYRYQNNFKNRMKADSTSSELESTLNTSIRDLILKADFSYKVSPKYSMRFGVSGTYHYIMPNDESYNYSDSEQDIERTYHSISRSIENAIYMEHEYNAKVFNLNAGARLLNIINEKQVYNFIEPRLNINLPINNTLSFKSSYSMTNQFMHLLSYSGVGMPADYWMPSTSNISPSSARQYTLGLAKTFKKGYQLTIEAYHKQLDGLIAFKPGKSFIGNLSSWENVVVKDGRGENYGVEMFLQRTSGKSTGWVGLTLSKADRQFKDLNSGKAFPFKYDRLLDISIVWNYEITKKVLLSATWTYGSGYPVTLASEHYKVDDQEVLVYDEINSFRMRDYHRMDIAINFPSKSRWGERNWTISIFNLYNRKNPYYYYYDRELLETKMVTGNGGIDFIQVYDNLKLYQKSLFCLLPSVGYSFKF